MTHRFDPNAAIWIGDHQDGWYVQPIQKPDGWYNLLVIDCETGGFVQELEPSGPYRDDLTAIEAGRMAAVEWIICNAVELDESVPPAWFLRLEWLGLVYPLKIDYRLGERCCARARQIDCVCAVYRVCPDHGALHVGTHD